MYLKRKGRVWRKEHTEKKEGKNLPTKERPGPHSFFTGEFYQILKHKLTSNFAKTLPKKLKRREHFLTYSMGVALT